MYRDKGVPVPAKRQCMSAVDAGQYKLGVVHDQLYHGAADGS